MLLRGPGLRDCQGVQGDDNDRLGRWVVFFFCVFFWRGCLCVFLLKLFRIFLKILRSSFVSLTEVCFGEVLEAFGGLLVLVLVQRMESEDFDK